MATALLRKATLLLDQGQHVALGDLHHADDFFVICRRIRDAGGVHELRISAGEYAEKFPHPALLFSAFQREEIRTTEQWCSQTHDDITAVSYTHLRAHETVLDLVCRLLLEKKTQSNTKLHVSH